MKLLALTDEESVYEREKKKKVVRNRWDLKIFRYVLLHFQQGADYVAER